MLIESDWLTAMQLLLNTVQNKEIKRKTSEDGEL